MITEVIIVEQAEPSYRRHVLCNRTILLVAILFAFMLAAAAAFAGQL